MADVNSTLPSRYRAPAGQTAGKSQKSGADPHLLTFIELLFFAYRDFTREADAVLAEYGLGRAHHRVLHFVDRHPGLRVADLLEILKITKQSLAPVLKELIDQGWIAQKAGESDRRQRLLFATEKGRELAGRLDSLQARRVGNALAHAGEGNDAIVARFLFAMISQEERGRVAPLLPERVGAGARDEKQ